jgi:dienelactone hydrolase
MRTASSTFLDSASPETALAMTRFSILCVSIFLPAAVLAADSSDLQKTIERPILASGQTLAETQKFCASKIPPLPEVKSAAEWEPLANQIRQEVLARAVYRGEAAKWRDAKLGVEWLETIPGGQGYRIRKLRYEALPGLWIPALLYEPERLAGKAPVFLNVNGHDPGGKAAEYKQIRCINLAKRGILALNPEWFGMGQLRTDGYSHGRMNQLDLCGTSGLAPFYLAMKRGLDVLLALPQADPTRVGVAGLSGGGWQTIIISSLDPRVTLSNPVAGYSSFITRGANFSDLGDSEQTPVDLATVADYSHLTALMAPRATLLTYNLNDNCCFKADHALPPLLAAARPFFRLYEKDDNLRSWVNVEPGDHNFQKENREALYQWVGRNFFAGDERYNANEIPSAGEVKTAEELNVELPQPNATFQSLAASIAKSLPRDAALPKTLTAALTWQTERRARLADIVKYKKHSAEASVVSEGTLPGARSTHWKLNLDGQWTVPLVELNRAKTPEGTVVLLGDAGRAKLAAQAEKFLSENRRVILVDPYYVGEASVPAKRNYLWALLISAVGDRPLGVQSSQIAAVARWLAGERQCGPVRLISHGPHTSLVAVTAAALEETAIGAVELHDPMVSLKEVIAENRSIEQSPELFCFGLLEWFDGMHIAALIAPRPVEAPQALEKFSEADRAALVEFFDMLEDAATGKE